MVISFLRSINRRAGVKRQARTHEVAGRVLPLSVVENPRAKRLTLRIEANGKGIKVTVPPGVPEREISGFLTRQKDWLATRIARLPENAQLRAGSTIPVRGVPCLIVHKENIRGLTRIERDTDDQPLLIVHGSEEHLSRRIKDFLIAETKKDIEKLVKLHTNIIGRKAKAIRLKDTKSRWGSCTSDGVLSFSWRMGMAPPAILNYLVAHEVAHLVEMNHGPDFWALCFKLCPDTAHCKAWLKNNGTSLQAIDFS